MDRRCAGGVLAGLLVLCGASYAQVVADDACPKHAVDVAAYATCDADKVASDRTFTLQDALRAEDSVSPSKRTSLGLYVDAVSAHRLKSANVQRVVLVDVRSQLEVALVGRVATVDIQVPYAEHTLYRNESGSGWTIAENSGFIDVLVQRLQSLNADVDAVIMVMCRSGERSAKVVDRLAEHGYLLAINVIDGFEGDPGEDGRRLINGWKNAGLPWTQDTQATLATGFIDFSVSN